MEHFWQTIQGWMDFTDLYAQQVARVPKSGAHFVEVGSFMGASAAFMAVEIANSGKSIQFDTCDTFSGIERVNVPNDAEWAAYQRAMSQVGTLEAACRANLAPVADLVRVRVGDSLDLASTYADGSLDFIFLDDDHNTLHVLRELDAWWPKLKPGGVLAGHDIDWADVRNAVSTWSIRHGRPFARVSERSWAMEKPVPADSWTVPRKRRRCLVAVCCNERTVARETVKSLVALGWGQRITDACQTHEFQDVLFAWYDRYLHVSDLRDEAALNALQLECSHVLFLDADMTWPTDVVSKMLAHHHRGMVGGIYYLKKWPHWPVALRDGVFNPLDQQVDYTYDDKAPHSGTLRPESLIGMGCTLVPTEVFKRLPRPWFEYAKNGAGLTTITEDVTFCQKVAALGCPIWIDPSISCGHVSAQVVDENWFNRSMIEKTMLEQQLAGEVKPVEKTNNGLVFDAR